MADKLRNSAGMALTILIGTFLLLSFLVFVAAAVTTKVNLGNVTGGVISLILLLCTVFHKPVGEFIRNALADHERKKLVIIPFIVICIAVITAAAISVMMIAQASKAPQESMTVIILGCRVKPEGPSQMLRTRTLAAARFMEQHPDCVCIASGGRGGDEPMSESEAIRDILIEYGISPDRIIMEDKSTSTRENFSFSKELIKERGLPEKIAIATSEYHQLRASMIAADNGFGECYSLPSAHTQLFLLPSYWIREWYGVIYEVVF